MTVVSSKGKQPPEMPLFDLLDRDRRDANPHRLAGPRPTKPRFPGPAFVAELDEVRLAGLQQAVFELMSDCQWRTHSEMKAAIGRGSETGIAAVLRNLKSKERGKHSVPKRRRGDPSLGIWEYQLIVNPMTKVVMGSSGR